MKKKYFSCLAMIGYLAYPLMADAQEQEVPIEMGSKICIEVDNPVSVPSEAELAAKIASFKIPEGLSEKQYQRLKKAARAFMQKNDKAALQHFSLAIENAAASVGLNEFDKGDAESLALTVLTEVSQTASNDLRAIIADIERINSEKDILQDYISELEETQFDEQRRCPERCDRELLDSIRNTLHIAHEELHSVSERGDLAQSNLQNLMSRKAAMLQMLQNFLKKMSDAAEEVIKNMGP